MSSRRARHQRPWVVHLAQDRGVGIGVAFAVAAAVLVAQSREDDPRESVSTTGWRMVAAALYLVAGLWGLAGGAVLVGSSMAGGGLTLSSIPAAWALAAPLLGLSAGLGWVGAQLFRRDSPAWAGGLALACCLVVAFVALREGTGIGPQPRWGAWSVDAALGGLAVLAVAAGTASCAAGVRRSLATPMTGVAGWLHAALGVLTVAAIGGVGLVAQAGLTVASSRAVGNPDRPTLIWFLGVSAVAVASLVAARVVLGRLAGPGRLVTLGLMSVVVLLAIVGYAVTEAAVGFLGLVVYFLAPLTVMAMVALPPSVRDKYGPLLAGGTGPEAGPPSGPTTGATGAGGSSPWAAPPS